MQDSSLSLSVLLTQEEYMRFTVQMVRRKAKKGLSFFTLLGGVLTILALAGFFFGHYISLSSVSSVCLLLLGLILLCYEGAIAPVIVRGAAARAYEEKDDLRTANRYVFTEKEVQVQNARLEGKLPLSWITEWIQTDEGFWISFGRECSILIPDRLLEIKDRDLLAGWLKESTENG